MKNFLSIVQAQHDLEQDPDEIQFLISDAKKRLLSFLRDIRRVKKHINATTYEQSRAQAVTYINELNALQTEKAYEYLRTHQALFGALITSTDWQSPSSEGSGMSQAGRETGKIYATRNDYKRDQHWDAYLYEQAFLKENIDAFIKFSIHVHATSSGMAAFTTILMFLSGEKKMNGKILCGASVYFQNKWLLMQSFPYQLIFVDESDTEKVLEAIDTHQPSVIFLDSLTNAPDIIVPDLLAIIKHLRATKKETYLIIDNTGLSVQLQPIPLVLGRRTSLRLIMFESLNKYHQFGMDRVSGGIMVGYGEDTGKLFDYRLHAGTIIADSIVASLPSPHRKTLIRRLARHARNATILARALQQWIHAHPDSPFESISYPGLGSYFTIKFKKQYATISKFKRFVKISLYIAKHHGVNLVSGTSFGLDTTRIYLTAMRSRPHAPFVRIAVGTEHIHTVESLRDVFVETLRKF